MHYNRLYCSENDLESSHKNNTWNLECNVEQVDILIYKNQALQILYLKHHDNVYITP